MAVDFEQLTLESFLQVEDVLRTVVPFRKEDLVKVVVPNIEEDSESHYYLLNFDGLQGKVSKVILQPVLQYQVDFQELRAIVYHEELRSW